jgi:phosphate:Na+ symporter
MAHAHVGRLHHQVVESIETSSLHLELIGDMKRLNSLFCSSAYVVLEAGESGALHAQDLGAE